MNDRVGHMKTTSLTNLLFMHILINEEAIPNNSVQLKEIPHPVRNRDAG